MIKNENEKSLNFDKSNSSFKDLKIEKVLKHISPEKEIMQSKQIKEYKDKKDKLVDKKDKKLKEIKKSSSNLSNLININKSKSSIINGPILENSNSDKKILESFYDN